MSVAKFNCPNCSSLRADIELEGEGDRPPLMRCAQCGAELFWPLPPAAELAAFYGGDNFFTRQGREIAEQYLADPKPTREALIAGFAADLEAFGTPRDGVVVDLGCSHGVNVIELRRLGYDACGIDLSRDGIKFLNAHGGKGYCGTILDHNCPVTHIDAVFSSHTFEEMPNPYAAFRKLHRLMRPGGLLSIAVPHWGGLVAQHMRGRWKWCGYPVHLHYFRATTLPGLLTGLGFKVVSIHTTAFPSEAREVFDTFDVAREDRTPAAASAVRRILMNGNLGEALMIKAVRA